MSEQLFKLKKDGKCVGYMHLYGAYAHYKVSLTDENWRSQRLFENLPEVNTSVTTLVAYPFVAEDKNGEKVFSSDRIRRVQYDGDPNTRKEYEGIVCWHAGLLRWSLKVGSDALYILEDLVDSEIFEAGIELIKEKP